MSTIANLYGSRTPSAKEQHCIVLVASGLTNKGVSRAMRISEHVVKNLLRSIYDKLGLWNRVELALWYERRKWESEHEHNSGPVAFISAN